MATFTPTNEEVPQFELLKAGLYPFEVLELDSGLGKGKTSSNTVLQLKCRFYSDNEFKVPVGQWTERITLPLADDECFSKEVKDLNEFFGRYASMFCKCCNVQFVPGQSLELDASTVVGLRGIADIEQRKIAEGPRAGEFRNQVRRWPTDKAKFPRNTPTEVEAPEPF